MKQILATLILGVIICMTMLSCNNDEPRTTLSEYGWVEGNYSGYYKQTTRIYHDGNFTTPETNNSFSKKCNVRVKLNSDNTLTILIRGEYNETLQNEDYSVSENNNIIKCDRYTFDRDAQSMRYDEFISQFFNNGYSWQQTFLEFAAYKDF